MTVNFLRYKILYYIFSGALIAASIFALFFWQLNLGIDFQGGSLLEIKLEKDLSSADIKEVLSRQGGIDLGEIILQKTEAGIIVLRFKEVTEETHQKILDELKKSPLSGVEEKSFQVVGPAIGQELKKRATYGILLAIVGMILYIYFAFRKVSYPVSSFKYALAAILALIHDVTITAGVFSFLGKFQGVSIGLPFVAALLTVLGYSINDTIIVFDRIRENLFGKVGKNFEETVNISLNQTLTRSLCTSLTTILALLAIYFFGGLSTKYFVLALLIGITVGTYSSIFIASPLLVSWEKRRKMIK